MLPLATSATILWRKMVETESMYFQEKPLIWKTAIFSAVGAVC